MLQQFLIIVVFLGALAYLARLLYRNFRSDTACSSGCGKCNTVDFSKIEKQLKARKMIE